MNKIIKCCKIVLFMSFSFSLSAQGIDDLGIMWTKTYGDGTILNIRSNPGGTYTGSGSTWNKNTPNGPERLVGLIIEFNEKGEELKRLTASIPQSYINAHLNTMSLANASFRFAFKTSDGGYLAFGELNNPSAPANEKCYDWSGIGASNNGGLLYGIWIVKFDANLNIIRNELVRGYILRAGQALSDGTYVVGGFDSNTDMNSGSTSFVGITLVRKYDKEGNLIEDGRTSYREISNLYKYPNSDDIIAVTPDRLLHISGSLQISNHALSSILSPHVVNTYANSVSPSVEGGVFISSNLNHNNNIALLYQGGSGFFKLKDNNIIEYVKKDIPAEWTYSAPLLLPGNNMPPKYVGTARNCESGFSNCKNYIYELTDDGDFTYKIGELYPDGTTLNSVSLSDGFFSCGQTAAGLASIAKLSTCANFKVDSTSDLFFSYQPSLRIAHTIPYSGAKASSKQNIKYSLETKVTKGTVNGKTAGQILESITNAEALTYIQNSGKASGILFELNKSYTLDPLGYDAEIQVSFIIEDHYEINGIPQQCNQSYLFKIRISKVSSTLFSDDIWFFGLNYGIGSNPGSVGIGNKTSKGIKFKNENGKMKPYDYSGVSMVNTWENSLSVSTPACDGGFLFYASHQFIYNSKHQLMKNGSFEGNASTADGLASCYIGNNEYLFFTVTNDNNNGFLKYYKVNMNSEEGLGELIPLGQVGTNRVSESIELIPKVGTYDQYWLLYFDMSDAKIKVRSVDGSNPSNYIGEPVYSSPIINYNTILYTLKSGLNFSKVMAVYRTGYFDLYTFDPLTGQMTPEYSKRFTTDTRNGYSGAFSPSGKYLYVTTWVTEGKVRQYETLTGTLTGEAAFTSDAGSYDGARGGGIKSGPDNRVYIERERSNYMAVIEDPESVLTQSGINLNGFHLVNNQGSNGVAVSTGLTPPWINPIIKNQNPITNTDHYVMYDGSQITFFPLTNDTDDGGVGNLMLTSVEVINDTQKPKVTYSFDETDKSVTFKVNDNVRLNNELVQLNYLIKDKGAPVQLCDEGIIHILVLDSLPLLLEDSCSFSPYLYFSPYSEAGYQWETSTTGAIPWSEISGETAYKLYAITDSEVAYYRVKTTLNGGTSYSRVLKLIKRSQIPMPGGIWYFMGLE